MNVNLDTQKGKFLKSLRNVIDTHPSCADYLEIVAVKYMQMCDNVDCSVPKNKIRELMEIYNVKYPKKHFPHLACPHEGGEEYVKDGECEVPNKRAKLEPKNNGFNEDFECMLKKKKEMNDIIAAQLLQAKNNKAPTGTAICGFEVVQFDLMLKRKRVSLNINLDRIKSALEELKQPSKFENKKNGWITTPSHYDSNVIIDQGRLDLFSRYLKFQEVFAFDGEGNFDIDCLISYLHKGFPNYEMTQVATKDVAVVVDMQAGMDKKDLKFIFASDSSLKVSYKLL